jgi:hypothetical protein
MTLRYVFKKRPEKDLVKKITKIGLTSLSIPYLLLSYDAMFKQATGREGNFFMRNTNAKVEEISSETYHYTPSRREFLSYSLDPKQTFIITTKKCNPKGNSLDYLLSHIKELCSVSSDFNTNSNYSLNMKSVFLKLNNLNQESQFSYWGTYNIPVSVKEKK